MPCCRQAPHNSRWVKHATDQAIVLNRRYKPSVVTVYDRGAPGRVLQDCQRIIRSAAIAVSLCTLCQQNATHA